MKVLDGPFAESQELIGGFAILELTDMDEAMDVSRRYAKLLGDEALELDLRLASPSDD